MDVRDREEAQLLAQVAAGDRGEPLVALYRSYAGRIHRLGLRTLGDPGQAEDLVQETFVRLWQSAPRFDAGRGSVRAFVFTLAQRAAVDQLRRASVRPRLVAAAQDGSVPEPVDPVGGEELVERVAQEFTVREAVQRLSPKHREVVELTFDEDLSDAQIADRLGVPVGTVRSRTYYALRALRLDLEERGLVG
ncbi:RNA polymerase sigma factor [Paraconexibacter algicola]|uniref:RNA polymerase subunit sigma-70 n=1 Tax=Paraconexibacter algicola TaxID=2133960 RepID=A0A2T4UJC6_9ACTN|nr:sigma-70 family RNA polymerase sigma factor [Paraconexibacter algicola]PTL59343.1 RNA polymerase subunit sigma-70 [Paraconexibacter algicola]